MRITPTHDVEDLEREPDGVPHAVVALTLLASVALAVLIVALAVTAPVTAVVVALVAIPGIVSGLSRTAEARRDVVHRSR
jgi:hypothetical protein